MSIHSASIGAGIGAIGGAAIGAALKRPWIGGAIGAVGGAGAGFLFYGRNGSGVSQPSGQRTVSGTGGGLDASSPTGGAIGAGSLSFDHLQADSPEQQAAETMRESTKLPERLGTSEISKQASESLRFETDQDREQVDLELPKLDTSLATSTFEAGTSGLETDLSINF